MTAGVRHLAQCLVPSTGYHHTVAARLNDRVCGHTQCLSLAPDDPTFRHHPEGPRASVFLLTSPPWQMPPRSQTTRFCIDSPVLPIESQVFVIYRFYRSARVTQSMTSPHETFLATWHQYHFAYHPRARCYTEETSHLLSSAESIYVELNEIECSRDHLNRTVLV
jgi:hypothetical protein